MRVAVVGFGWSGALLTHKLSKLGHDVSVFDKSRTVRSVCACAIPTDLFVEIAHDHGLNPDDYILWRSKELIIDAAGKQHHIPTTGLCTIKKNAVMTDLMNDSLPHIACFFGKTIHPSDYQDYDLIVDATGYRALLGRLPADRIFSTYQVKAEFKELPFPDFYMGFPFKTDTQSTKYAWMFPLSSTVAYVGCGSFCGKQAYNQVQRLLENYEGKVIETQARLLRVNPPSESLPFFNGKIVGVGNNVGAITSFGEGNQLAAETVNLLVENLQDLEAYQAETLKKLSWLKYDYKIHDALIQGGIVKSMLSFLRVLKVYRKRFRVKVTMKLVKNVL